MAKGLVASMYSLNLTSKRTKKLESNIKMPTRIRLLRSGQVLSERCPSCSGFEFKNKKIQPAMQKKFQHRKGCKYAN